MRQVPGAEILETRPRQALPRDPGVAGELLTVRQVAGGDLEPWLPVESTPHAPPGGGTEERPAQGGLDPPWEVVVQGGDLRIGTRIREIDGVPAVGLLQGLAGIEIPAEERVDRERDVLELRLRIRSEKVAVHPVTVMQRRCGIV